MVRKATMVSFITKPKPCTAMIEFVDVPEDIEALGNYLYPQDSEPWQMPVLVTEESKNKKDSDLELIYPEAIQYLIIRALSKDVSIIDFAESLVVFCERFGRLFRENRLSVIEARERLGWPWLLLPLYRNSTKQRNVNKEWVSTLKRFIYEPYKVATKNYPDNKGNFVIDFFSKDGMANEFRPFAHPVGKTSDGFFLPNKGPRNSELDVILKWCQDVVLMNMNRFLKKNIVFITKFNKNMQLNINIKAPCVYSAALLLFVERDIDWLSLDDISMLRSNDDYMVSLARKDRRDALSVFRNWKNRDKLTESEYKELVEYSKQLIPKHLNKEEMEKEMKNHLKKVKSKP